MTKAEILYCLTENISDCIIDDFIYFTVEDWFENKISFVNQINEKFVSDTLIIRSSSVHEDTIDESCAGKYTSIANIDSSNNDIIIEGIGKVIDSYEKDNVFLQNQIIIQKQVADVSLSGVLFSYDYRDNSPYYLIEFDDSTKKTDTITGFGERKRILIARECVDKKPPHQWRRLITMVSQIEDLFHNSFLGIEFAFDSKNEIHVFQARTLKNKAQDHIYPKIIGIIEDGLNKYIKYKNVGFSLFSNMSDWNPIEMLGSNPKPLSISLYQNLISDIVWKRSRESLGYFSPLQDHLIDVFCGKPYVNVACSLLSLTPNNLSPDIKKKILKHGLLVLEKNKYLHDKIEFEIALSSMFLNLEKFHLRLKEYHLYDSEIKEYIQSIQNLTCNMIKNHHSYIEAGKKSLETLENITDKYKSLVSEDWNNYNIFIIINELIDKTKNWGVFHFSIIARMAFVGEHLTKQLLNERFLTDAQYHNFYSSINTIPGKINIDIQNISNGFLSKEEFLEQYGHLRINTYDIESPQYCEIYDEVLDGRRINTKSCNKENLLLQYSNDKVLLDFRIEDILTFTRNASEYREIFKYEFTKTVSFILETLKRIALESGISITEFAYLRLEDFRDLDNREKEKLRDILIAIIQHRKSLFDKSSFVKLPDVISGSTDFYYFEEITAKPNFITTLRITADILYFSNIQSVNVNELNGKIILKETMEPGCDWILLYPIAGIITKFGGVASHIAIRCRELNIPAVIGCGNYFDVLKNTKKIKIDSLNQKIHVIHTSCI